MVNPTRPELLDSLPLGKRQVMEKFFTPVYRPPTQDEIKLRKHNNHRHFPHDHPQHHHHPHPVYHSQDESHSYTKLDGNDENTDDSQAQHHQHRRHQQTYHLHDNLPHDYHQPQHPQHHHYPPQESEIHNQQQTTVTLSRAASSSLSSSSSSLFSSSSWQTEASVNDPFSARPAQHSLSCSNILEVRTGFREDDGSEPIVFATVKRGAHKASPYGSTEGRSRQNEHRHAPSYDRDQSHSDEGLLQTSEDEVVAGRQRRAADLHHGALYKTASLGRSLAFSEENLVLGASGRPQRGVPSNQIPGKGILKNREPPPDIRKARSMEVLSPRVAKGQGKGRDKGKEVTPAEMKIARENFVQGKLQFSAFLDEITKQVISPSNLNILGVNNDKTPGDTPEPVRGPGTAKPQLPIKKHRESCSGEEKEQHHKPPATQEKRESCGNSPSCHASHTDQSDPDKLTSYVARRHRGSPPPHHHPQTPSDGPHPGGNRKKEKSVPVIANLSHNARESDVRRGSHLTDGTSTSPEPVLPKQRNHRKHRNASPRSPHPPDYQHLPHIQPRHGYTSPGQQEEGHGAHKTLGSAPGPESEPGFCKSDSSRTRDTAFTSNSQNSDQSVRHRSQAARKGHTDSHHKVLLGGSDQFQALQEENTDLHQNLLQTVVCIESLEAELNRTREELSHVKDKYKSLVETHTGTRQTNTMLGEHLHIASESLSSERKYLINRIAELSSELEEAHRTIAALETINVPCLIKELLEKHFDSAEAVQKFLKTATAVNHPKMPSPPDPSQSGASNVVEVPHDWSEAGPRRVTAFMPWKQEASAGTASAATASTDGGLPGAHGASHSQPFSIADISAAIYKKIASEFTANHKPSQTKSLQGCPKGTNHTGTTRPPAHVRQVLETAELAPGLGDVTYLSAQQVLDEFMNQLQPQNQASGGKEQQVSHI
ncbi:Tight junction-associated protein 1 [Merluccius polli]|uniref:Tight junction-associated protein 1 n=1 Tax=Merluccius polli TaxID=89951 RepID=A0AA47MF39_MERPO|nr:Tight junction-associated protein 1 [Merluccius polli]